MIVQDGNTKWTVKSMPPSWIQGTGCPTALFTACLLLVLLRTGAESLDIAAAVVRTPPTAIGLPIVLCSTEGVWLGKQMCECTQNSMYIDVNVNPRGGVTIPRLQN